MMETAPVEALRTTTAVVPPHAGSRPLTAAQLHRARIRIALEMLTAVVQELEACPPAVRQAATHALAALVELQALLTAQDAGNASQTYPELVMGHSVLREQ
jgi:hypothetical protein